MWIFNNKKRDAFEERERRQCVWRFVRRLIDAHTPHERPAEMTNRNWERYNRCVPVALIPVIDGDVAPGKLIYVATKELSENGLSVISYEPIDCSECICGFWLDGPRLASGVVRRIRPFGGGLFEVGIELLAVVESADILHQIGDKVSALVPAES